jgi:hypothetical protein
MSKKSKKRQTFCRSCGVPMGERIVSKLAPVRRYCAECFGDLPAGTSTRGGLTVDELQTVVDRGEDGCRRVRAAEARNG